MRLWNYIRDKMMEQPDRTVSEGTASMTYEELCIYAEVLGPKLSCPYYCILCKSEFATAIALLCCVAAGKCAIPLPTRYGWEYCKKIMDVANPPCLLTDLTGELSEMPLTGKAESKIDDFEPAVILFTSGSTGAPKGVMLSDTNLISNMEDIATYFPIGSTDTLLIARPLYHSSVLTGEFLLGICKGANIIFSSEAFHPQNILTLMKNCHVTVYGSTPSLLAVLARFIRKRDDSKIRLLSISGECMTAGMAQTIRGGFPKAQIFCGYGLSEASPRVAYLPSELFDEKPTVAGISLPSVELHIVDRLGQLVSEPNRVGELLVRGPNIMQGYFNDPIRTRAILMDGWLHTGDLACWNEEGLLCIKGRKDDMIIRAGMNIYPAEIENVLSLDPRVRDVIAYGYSRNDTQEIGLKVFGDFTDKQEVLTLCRQVLSAFQIPSQIELLSENDIASSGKKSRK